MKPTLHLQIPQGGHVTLPRQPERPGLTSHAFGVVLGLALLGAPLLMRVLATTAVL
jgi:hypothetical protein